MLYVTEPVENIALRMIAKTATLTESSMAAAAKRSVGIPLETP